MKFIVLIIFYFFSSFATADADDVTVGKALKFLKTKKSCSFAVGRFIKDPKLWRVPMGSGSNHIIQSTVYCVSDLTRDEGTINEKHGCAFVDYDLENNNYKPAAVSFYTPLNDQEFFVSEHCGSGGFKKLLEMDTARGKIKEILAFGPDGRRSIFENIIIYSENSTYQKIFTSAVSKIQAEQKAADELAKKQELAQKQVTLQQQKKAAIQKAESLKNIEGIWLNGCMRGDPGTGMSFQEVEKYDGGVIDIFRTYSKSDSCSSAKLYVVHIRGTYKVGGFVDRQQNIKAIDLVPQKYEVAPLNGEITSKFNEDLYLGYMDWKERAPKDVSRNKEFRGKVGKVIYSIYKLDAEKSYGPWSTQEDAQNTPAKRALLKPDLSKPSIRQSSIPDNFDLGGIFK